MDGVEAIALYKDIPNNSGVGPIRKDHYPIVNDHILYGGDVLAVVAAQSKKTAQAANLIIVPIKC